MRFGLFSLIVLEDILFIILKSHNNISWSSWLHNLDLVLYDSSLLDHIFKPIKWLFIAEVDVDLIASLLACNKFYLFLFHYLCGHLVIGWEQIFRLIYQDSSFFSTDCHQSQIWQDVNWCNYSLRLTHFANHYQFSRCFW